MKLEEYDIPGLFIMQAVVCIVVFLMLVPIPRGDGHLVSADGARYFSYVRSMVVDHDIDVRNDLDLLNQRMSPSNPARAHLWMAYAYPIGTPLLWIPAYVPAHYAARLLDLGGFPIALDGFSYLEEGAVCVANILYLFAGLLFVYKALRAFFPRITAVTSVLLLTAGSSIINYALLETWMSHSGEVFSIGLFLWFVLAKGRPNTAGWCVAGLLLGLVFLVRWQNAVFGVAMILFLRRMSWKPFTAGLLAKTVGMLALFALAFAAVCYPQLLFWKTVFGSWMLVPQGGDWFVFSRLHTVEVLTSTRHGMYLWTPLLALGTIGVFLLKDRWMRWTFVAVILLELLVCSTMWEWWAGESFGMRRMIGVTPLFMFGYAELYERLEGARRRILLAASGAAIAWTLVLFVLYATKLIPRDGFWSF